MMAFLISWWAVLSLIGWLLWPILSRLFGHMPSRGYAFAKPLGVLIWSYLFWLLGMGGLPNTRTFCWAILIALVPLCLYAAYRERDDLLDTLRREWPHILGVEILFLSTYAAYALHRSFDPAIQHTEQPMNFAFINGILRSPNMPPRDPWLTGNAISYYYLGHFIIALLTKITTAPSGIGYNLGLSSTFAATCTALFGLLYELVLAKSPSIETHRQASRVGLWGAILISLASNVKGMAVWLHSLRYVIGRILPAEVNLSYPQNWLPNDGWWWWDASRAIYDAGLLGHASEAITEFPAFSFLLGDLHAHVLALPYLVIGCALALQLYLAAQEPHPLRRRHVLRLITSGWIIGALGFLNTWDLPVALGLAMLASALGGWRRQDRLRSWLATSALDALWLLVGALAPYIPFYLGLTSQAKGVGVAYFAKTSLGEYLLCFGLWLLPIASDLASSWGQEQRFYQHGNIRKVLWISWMAILLLPWLLILIMGGWGRLTLSLAQILISGPWVILLQSFLLALTLADLVRNVLRETLVHDPGRQLARLFILMGLALTYMAEFFYLRDVFDTRMNTIFKTYYQAWILLGTGGLYSLQRLWQSGGASRSLGNLATLLLVLALFYPAAMSATKTGGYSGKPTLDGTAFLERSSAGEYRIYQLLLAQAEPDARLAEAPGEEYVAHTSRLSAWTGIPTILGWPGHEAQWRGDDAEIASRQRDLQRIYMLPSKDGVLSLLHKYEVTYLYLGPDEMEAYSLQETKANWYASFLDPIFAGDHNWLYRVPY